ncbi:MAG: paraslipin, partial [Thalassotalea sp.]|nr:paraslipin [Thalassotalea sp.]
MELLQNYHPTDLAVFFIWGAIFLIFIIKLFQSICLVPTKSAYVVERLGKYSKTLDAGFHALLPFIDRVAYIQDLKEETIDVPPQECFSRDEVNVEVDGVIYISVTEPIKSSYGIVDYRFAAMQLAQTTTRSVIGTLDLDRTFEERNVISAKVVEVLDKAGEAWGIR